MREPRRRTISIHRPGIVRAAITTLKDGGRAALVSPTSSSLVTEGKWQPSSGPRLGVKPRAVSRLQRPKRPRLTSRPSLTGLRTATARRVTRSTSLARWIPASRQTSPGCLNCRSCWTRWLKPWAKMTPRRWQFEPESRRHGRLNRDELLKQKTALEEKIKESERRSAELKSDQDRIRQELGDLHDRAKAERGCSAADAGGVSATSTTGSPAADGSEANAAIATLRALVGARIASEEQRAEGDAIFGALVRYLGRLPFNPVGAAQPPAQQQADGGTGAGAASANALCGGTAGEAGQQEPGNAETPQAESYTLCSGGESEQEQEDVEMVQREGESPEDYCSRMQEKMAKRKAEREKGRQARRQRKAAAAASSGLVVAKGKGQ